MKFPHPKRDFQGGGLAGFARGAGVGGGAPCAVLSTPRLAHSCALLLPPAEELAWLPDKDRPVLAAAMRLRCDALVTGDRTHFGAGYGRSFGGVVVHSPRSLAEHLLA